MGISAVHWAVGGPTAPYFRFPALRQPQELIDYLGKRNIAIFSTDMDSFDFKMRKPEQVRQSVMEKLKKHGKGIVLVQISSVRRPRPPWTCSTISRPAATRSCSCSQSSQSRRLPLTTRQS